MCQNWGVRITRKTPKTTGLKESAKQVLQHKSSLLTFWWLFRQLPFSSPPMALQFVRFYTDSCQELVQLKNILLFLCSFSACSLCSLFLSVTMKATAWDIVKAKAMRGGSWQQYLI